MRYAREQLLSLSQKEMKKGSYNHFKFVLSIFFLILTVSVIVKMIPLLRSLWAYFRPKVVQKQQVELKIESKLSPTTTHLVFPKILIPSHKS